MLRCKEGDLAVVIHEEPGCDVNVGRTVTVSGPVKIHERLGPTWLIQPTQRQQWAVAGIGCVTLRTPPLRLVEHPDKWLMPLRPQEPDETAQHHEEQPAPETKVREEQL